jgi:hypothetical protein
MFASFFGWNQQAVLTAADGVRNDHIGISVALSRDGSTALIGAPERQDDAGAAYIFQGKWSSWAQAQELTTDSSTFVGRSVALSGDGMTVLVGAPYVNDYHESAAAYVFTSSAPPAPTATNTP